MNTTRFTVGIVIGLLSGLTPAMAQDRRAAPPTPTVPAQPAARGTRPPNPARDAHTPGYVTAKDLPDGAVPPLNEEGNFIIGPTHNPGPDMTVREDVPRGTVYNFTMSSTDSK